MSWKKFFLTFLLLGFGLQFCPSIWSAQDVERIFVRLNIRPTLSLRVVQTGSRGGADIDLGTFYPGEYWKSSNINDFRSLIVAVTTNLGFRYQVFEEASGPLQTDDGHAIPETAFRVFTIGGSQTKGRTLQVEIPIPVTQAPTLLFTSDEQGSSDFFSVNYILDPNQGRLPQDQAAGMYTTTITYTVAVL